MMMKNKLASQFSILCRMNTTHEMDDLLVSHHEYRNFSTDSESRRAIKSERDITPATDLFTQEKVTTLLR